MDTHWPQDLARELDRRAAKQRGARGPRLIPQTGPGRDETEAFIATVFRRAHGARITHFMPVLLGMRGADGRLLAACGLRAASGAALFLEQYLDGAVEQVMHSVTGTSAHRSAIAEIGNLAVVPPSSARQLIAALTRFLVPTPFEWVVFTALPSLRNAFVRLGIPVACLGAARLEQLPAPSRVDWGSYYEGGPQVCAVCVDDAHTALGVLQGLL